jgi:hypothetical protein
MFNELEELVENLGQGDDLHNNFCAVKHDILKVQKDHEDEIKGSICNEWLF